MSADYDLVILGGTLEGRTAAMTAVGYGARVALVEPPGLFERNQQQRYLLQGLQQLGRGLQRQAVGQWFGLSGAASGELNWAAVLEWSAIASETQSASLSPAVMSASGVDVILEMPDRLSRQMVVTTASRQLRSRAVLAAFGLSPDVFDPLLNAKTLPEEMMIWGDDERAVQWAEALNLLGVRVSLQTAEVLPGWDETLRGLMRSHIIATGIHILDPAKHPLSLSPEGTLFLNTQQPALSLPQFTYIDSQPHRYPTVNRRLQTAHPRVFACGSVLGRLSNDASAKYEATLAVRNALFLPIARVDYRSVAYGNDQFAQVGVTQPSARKRRGNRIQVCEASHANSADLSRVVPQLEYCKLVGLNNRLIGIRLLGAGAGDLAQALTGAIAQPIEKLGDFVGQVSCSQSLIGLVREAASQSQQERWQIGHWRRDWAENWFNWRRSR